MIRMTLADYAKIHGQAKAASDFGVIQCAISKAILAGRNIMVNVKISIERLAKSGVIQLPALQVFEKINNLGLRRSVEAYVFEGEQGKRDSIIVVAQLSPEFTARLVDRWRELEDAAVNIPKTLPEALRLAADLAEQKMQLENQLAISAPKVEFADRVGEASGILIGNFAKVVGIGPNKLFAWMRDHKILIASGSRRNVPMQEYMDRGYFTVKETAVKRRADVRQQHEQHCTAKRSSCRC